MEFTTIKLHKETKLQLNRIKRGSDSYDRVIRKLIVKEKQIHLKEDLINSYKKLGKEDLDMVNEWEAASKEV